MSENKSSKMQNKLPNPIIYVLFGKYLLYNFTLGEQSSFFSTWYLPIWAGHIFEAPQDFQEFPQMFLVVQHGQAVSTLCRSRTRS